MSPNAAALAAEIRQVQRARRGEDYRRRLAGLGLIPDPVGPKLVVTLDGADISQHLDRALNLIRGSRWVRGLS